MNRGSARGASFAFSGRNDGCARPSPIALAPRRPAQVCPRGSAMTRLLSRLLPFAVLGGLIIALTAGTIPAQQPLPQLPPAAQPGDPNAQPGGMPDGSEVLARGPVHEAFASTAETTTATPV